MASDQPTRTEAGAVDLERLAAILRRHPMQYGYRESDDEPVFDPPADAADIRERYNRCPICEQWSPCDVRLLVAALADAERRAGAAEESAAHERRLNEQHQTALEAAERDLAACREAAAGLVPWLRHHSYCARVTEDGFCSCGLQEAVAFLDTLGPADGG